MSQQHNIEDWHLYADRFIWYDTKALTFIPEDISDKEVQQYLYTFHGDNISTDEIRKWRGGCMQKDQ